MINCAITGSTGVLGKRIKKLLPYKFYEFKEDLRNKKKVERWVFGNDFDIIIHLAALVPVDEVNKNYKKAYNINVTGTLNLINSILKKKIKPRWFFFSSTSHVYKSSQKYLRIRETFKTKPQNKYGKTKLLAENLLKNKLKDKKIKLCIGRIFSFTDKNQKPPYVIPSIKKKINSKNKNILLENLNHYRDFLSTKDIVKAIDTLRKKDKTGIYNIGSGKKFKLKEIAKLLAKKKKLQFKDNLVSTYLISDNSKLKSLKWRPLRYKKKLEYFYK